MQRLEMIEERGRNPVKTVNLLETQREPQSQATAASWPSEGMWKKSRHGVLANEIASDLYNNKWQIHVTTVIITMNQEFKCIFSYIA